MSVTATTLTAASDIEAVIRRYAGVQRAKAVIVKVAAALVVSPDAIQPVGGLLPRGML